MESTTAFLSIGAAQADALFMSRLQRCDEPSASQVRQAVAESIRTFGYSGCAGRVAQEFGDHPETAVARMRWARAVAGEAFAESAPQRGGARHARELMAAAGRVADGMIVSARLRLLAHMRAGTGKGAALEMERHLRVLHYMWRLACRPVGAKQA